MALLHSMNISHCNFPLSSSSKILLMSSSFASLQLQFSKNVKRLESSVPPSAAVAASSAFPIDIDYLRREFSGQGTTFEDIGETCIAKLKLDNGSTANVIMTRGMVTSYKVKVWHEGKVELLHTWVEVEQEEDEEEEEVVIRGGVSSAFSLSDSDNEINEWRLFGISADSTDRVQMELRRSDKKIKEIEMKQIITLREETLSIGGRVLCPFRNRLLPKNVQALLCTRNWLRGFADFEGDIEEHFDDADRVLQRRQAAREYEIDG